MIGISIRCFLKWLSLIPVAAWMVLPSSAGAGDDLLRMLVWQGYAPEKSIKIFQKYIENKYDKNIKIKVSFVSNSDSFYDPVRSKTVDIISPTYHMFNDQRWALIDKGLILPLDIDNLPNFNNISSVLQKASYLERNGQKYAAPLAQGPYGLVYNTSLIKQVPESWNVLWAPEYRGKYVIAENEYMHNCMLTALALGYPRDTLHSFDALNNDEFKAKLAQLANNAYSFWDGIDKPDDLFGHSLATSWGFALKELKDRGEVWKLAEPEEGTVYWVDNYAITWALKDKPLLRKIAEEWINYTLSPEFQVEVILRDLSCFPVTTNIRQRLTKDEISTLNIDKPETYQKTRIRESDLSLRDRHGLELLWKEAMKKREKR